MSNGRNRVVKCCEVAGYRWVANKVSDGEYAVKRSWGDGQQTEDMGTIRRSVNGWRTPDDERCDSVRAALWSFAARCVGRELRMSGGYLYRELEAAFRRVRNPHDWKAPIRARIDASVLPVTAAAVLWFTGTELRVCAEAVENGRRILDVAAVGYREGPGGDH